MGKTCLSKEFNKPLRCQHWQMHRYVKILLFVECLQSVQYAFYISAKLSHYKEKNKKDIIKNHLTKPANNVLRLRQHSIIQLWRNNKFSNSINISNYTTEHGLNSPTYKLGNLLFLNKISYTEYWTWVTHRDYFTNRMYNLYNIPHNWQGRWSQIDAGPTCEAMYKE